MSPTGKSRRGAPRASGRGASRGATPARPRARPASEPPREPAPVRGTLRVGVTPGAAPGKWLDRFADRFGAVTLTVVPLDARTERSALENGLIDIAFARLPLVPSGDEAARFHIIPLYREDAVAMVAKDSGLAAADTLTLTDFAGEVHVRPMDDVLDLEILDTEQPVFAAPATTPEALAIIAAGVGCVVVPASFARTHGRRDIESRPLTGDGTGDAPGTSTVAVVWRRDGDAPDALIDAFVGVVRGRTARSSR